VLKRRNKGICPKIILKNKNTFPYNEGTLELNALWRRGLVVSSPPADIEETGAVGREIESRHA
jgi:hypothetical protein